MTTDDARSVGDAAGVGGSSDGQLKALGRESARTARRVSDLEKLVRQLAADVTALARVARAAPPGPGAAGEQEGDGPPAVRAWLLANNPEQAAADLTDLIEWLDRVYLAYQGSALPSCWLWHLDVIEELWWLRRAHAEAYHSQVGNWLRVGDWHDRQRPGVVKRIRTATHGCELSLHIPGDERGRRPEPRAPLTAAATAIAAWVAAGRPGLAPAPTGEQLVESDTYLDALHRIRR